MSGLIKVNNNQVTRTGGLVGKTSAGISKNLAQVVAQPDKQFAEQALKKSNSFGYVFDRTGSRQSTWDQAIIEQEKLLQKGSEMKVRMVHFGGDGIKDTGWHLTPRPLIDEMKKASCLSGSTQIIPSLDRFSTPVEAPRAVMLVGDAYEEVHDDLHDVLRKFITNGTRIFAYQEGNDSNAEKYFKQMAEMTKGAYLKLGEEHNMDLGDATDAAMVWAKEGDEGLKKMAQLGNNAAKTLASSMKLLNG